MSGDQLPVSHWLGRGVLMLVLVLASIGVGDIAIRSGLVHHAVTGQQQFANWVLSRWPREWGR